MFDVNYVDGFGWNEEEQEPVRGGSCVALGVTAEKALAIVRDVGPACQHLYGPGELVVQRANGGKRVGLGELGWRPTGPVPFRAAS